MATRKTAAAAAETPDPKVPQLDPEQRYRVVVARVLEIAPNEFARPHDTVLMKGKRLVTVLDSVESYEEA